MSWQKRQQRGLQIIRINDSICSSKVYSTQNLVPKKVSFHSKDESNRMDKLNLVKMDSKESNRTPLSASEIRSVKLSMLLGDLDDQPKKGHFRQKVLKLQHEGKIKTVGRGLERDMMKLIFRGDIATQVKRKEEIQNEIEHLTNKLRKVNVVVEHLKKKREVETMKVRVKLEKELKQTKETAKGNKDKSISDLNAENDLLLVLRDKRASEQARAEKQLNDLRNQIKRVDIYLVSFQRSLFGFHDEEMSAKKFKNAFINIYDQFMRDNVQDPLAEFMRKEKLLKRIHSSSCKRVSSFRSKSMPAQNRLEFHSSLYFSIIELQNETSKMTTEKIKQLKMQRAHLLKDFTVLSNHYYRTRDMLEQKGADVEQYKIDLPF
ncbi:uncharacterized protein LOC142340883 isoform X2 [Convolutriloba macropyga]|uniref:uncharacterized protein LOC142340883 isoform X2 n=1 Tax=Convolutriloba macropyga TaxID=536237 RepID=UPI003F526DE2